MTSMEMYQGRRDDRPYVQASSGVLRVYADGHYHGVPLTEERCAKLIEELAYEWRLLRSGKQHADK